MAAPRRSVVGLFARPRSAERALRALLVGDADLAAISVVTQERPTAPVGGQHQGERGWETERLLALALDGDLGRRVGVGVLAVGYPRAIVIVGALAARLRDPARGTAEPLGAALAAIGIPPPALPRYLAAIGIGQALVMVEAALPERERCTRNTFAHHGAVEIHSHPAPLPRRSPALQAGVSADRAQIPAEPIRSTYPTSREAAPPEQGIAFALADAWQARL